MIYRSCLRNLQCSLLHFGRHEGLLAFTKGLKPALLRQATYGSLRIGLYPVVKRFLGVRESSMDWRKVVAAVVSGGFSAFVCTPTDLIKIRMQAHDGSMRKSILHASGDLIHTNTLPYRGIWHAALTIREREGLLGFYRGAGPTTARAAAVLIIFIFQYHNLHQIPPTLLVVNFVNTRSRPANWLRTTFLSKHFKKPAAASEVTRGSISARRCPQGL